MADRKSMYDSATYQDCLARINKITADTKPQWGKMDAAQMFAHSADIQEVTNGDRALKTPFLLKLLKGVIKKTVFGDVPFEKNSRTHPAYVQKDSKDFDVEKARFLSALEKFHQNEKEAADLKHPLFGKLSAEEKGWSVYKHTDHHLRQFGV